MSKNQNYIFKGLSIIAWIIFVGLCIEAGALLVNFILSLYKPEIVSRLYQKLDLSSLYQRSQWAYFGMYSFILAVALLKATLFYLVVQLVHHLDLAKPFNKSTSKQITQISYNTLTIGIVNYIARQSTQQLQHHGFETMALDHFWVDSQAFILMAAVIYIIAAIFAKGVEIQYENDLTV